MNGKTFGNHADISAENKACRNGWLYVYCRYSAVFGQNAGESLPCAANDLAGNGKTNRPATGRQSSAGLSMNESDLRYAC